MNTLNRHRKAIIRLLKRLVAGHVPGNAKIEEKFLSGSVIAPFLTDAQDTD
ncbi:MAG: hypothetical protein Q7S46_14010 [Gallionella sp.]|nr:hypothetical protein [Gallionella sp.]